MIKKAVINQNGIALALILMIFAVVSVLTVTGLTISLSETRQSVSAENYVEAYYIARSATDTVSADLINQIKALNSIKPNDSSTQDDIDAYNVLQAKVENILTTSTVTVNGIIPDPITTRIICDTSVPGEMGIVVATTYELEGRSSTAKVQLGKIRASTAEITLEGEGTNAIYAWGDISIGNSLTITGGGDVSYGGTASIKDKDLVADVSILPVDIIPPPAEALAVNLKSLDAGKKGTLTIDNTFNGNHKTVNLDEINWNVDTSKGDVILLFNELVSNDGTINVSGNNNLYIYLMESPTNPSINTKLMDFKNNFNIIGKHTSGEPKTYFISYTKSMQDIYNPPSNRTTATSTELLPFDSAFIKNSAQLDAFFYLPGTTFEIFQGTPEITGSIFAGDFTLGNSAQINFKPYKPSSILANLISIGSRTETIETFTLEALTNDSTDLNKIWIK